jgi:hypothetical protein
LVSPRTWLAYAHTMAGLFIGLVASVLAFCLLTIRQGAAS